MTDALPEPGEFVEVRGRRWLVEGRSRCRGRCRELCGSPASMMTPGARVVEVAWPGHLDSAGRSQDDTWSAPRPRWHRRTGNLRPPTSAPSEWNTATAGDRDLFQAPFRAGIQLNAYQLLPLRKALRLPRVNLLIADDVGLGKTIEAGLILRELLLRRRIDLIVVAAPKGVVRATSSSTAPSPRTSSAPASRHTRRDQGGQPGLLTATSSSRGVRERVRQRRRGAGGASCRAGSGSGWRCAGDSGGPGDPDSGRGDVETGQRERALIQAACARCGGADHFVIAHGSRRYGAPIRSSCSRAAISSGAHTRNCWRGGRYRQLPRQAVPFRARPIHQSRRRLHARARRWSSPGRQHEQTRRCNPRGEQARLEQCVNGSCLPCSSP